MNFLRKKWLQSRWIEMPALPPGVLLKQNLQCKHGLVLGMRVAVLEEQAAAILVDNRLIGAYLPGAYQLEANIMQLLEPDPKYDWLFLAEVVFLNMGLFAGQPWRPAAPVLTRDPDLGLLQLEVSGTYTAQVNNAVKFLQQMVLARGYRSWQPIDEWLCRFLSERSINLFARQQASWQRLEKMGGRFAQILTQELNQELAGLGLVVREIRLDNFNLHPTSQRLLTEKANFQQESAAYNSAMMRSIIG